MTELASQPQQIALQNVTANEIRIGSITQTINYTQRQMALSSVVNESLPPLPSNEIWQVRDEEKQLWEWLRAGTFRLIGLEGAGGYGKSATAAQVCQTALGFDRAPLWVNFQIPIAFGTFARWVMRSIVGEVEYDKIRETYQALDDEELSNRILGYLTQKRYLLVLDNLETLFQSTDLWQPYGNFLAAWLGQSGGGCVLLTSQYRLELPRGAVWQWLALRGLQDSQGIALLEAEGVRGETADLAAFVKAADGHPLLLMLAVNLLKRQEKEDQERPEIVRLGQSAVEMLRGIVEMHRGDTEASVGRVLDASFERLYPGWMQKLLYRLSLIRGEFGVESAIAMVDEVVGLADLRRLVRWSFLQETKIEGEWRFTFLPLIARYLQMGAQEAGELDAGHEGAIQAYAPLRDRILKAGTRASERVTIYPYQEIFYHLCELERYGEAFKNVYSTDETHDNLDEFLRKRGFNQERYQMYSRLTLEWQPESPEEWNGYATALRTLGEALSFLDRRDEALSTYQNALIIFQDIDDRLGEANVLQAIGDVLQFKDRRDEALSTYQNALIIFQDIDARLGEANVYDSLALVARSQTDFPTALKFHQQALKIFQMMKSPYNEGWSWLYIARIQVKLGQSYPAKQSYEAAKIQFDSVGMDSLVAQCNQEMKPINQHSNVQVSAPPMIDRPLNENTTDWHKKQHQLNQPKTYTATELSTLNRKFFLWFCVGIAIVLLIAWLSK